ncbi:hypothetical protein KGM_207427 [Danaus plexippus plexippus]|uniref:Uncharacterized protein n=1 Tax=Danaus plexippus plexippus TaxID=278856 RepID=A0A212FPG5_DANPL|nr:hypothetical protein KGM_207427 [Danaus plexippus plexippus]
MSTSDPANERSGHNQRVDLPSRSWSSWALICLRSGSPRRAEPNAAARAPCIQFTAALLPDVYFGA